VPEVTDGVFRPVFFFSFFGRIVSELGFARILPFPPGPPTLTCGTELTVSASTVIFLVDSPDGFPLPAPALAENDFVEGPLGRNAVTGGAGVLLILISLLPPLSLPLSFAAGRLDLALIVEAWDPSSDGALIDPSSDFSWEASKLLAGVFGWLISCTVSNVELAPLAPLAGVLMPGANNESSTSDSVRACFPSEFSGAFDVR
jgi:hypothetical protein